MSRLTTWTWNPSLRCQQRYDQIPGCLILLSCRDHQVVQTTANRIMEILPDGSMIDKITTYDEYLENADARKRQAVYSTTEDEENDD